MGKKKEQQKNGKCKAQANACHQVRERSSVSDDIPDGYSTCSLSTGSNSDTMTGEEPGLIVHNAVHNFQLDSAVTSMMLMFFSLRFAIALNLKVLHPALCFGSTVTSVVCGCTIIIFQKYDVSRKYMCSDCSANSHCIFNDVLVCMFMHFNCLRSCMEAIIPVLDFFEHVKFSVLLSPR